jgi:quaternary ammonium compound-resistance protein SugE
MAWVLLFVAGLLEPVWAVALKQSDGFSRLWPSLVFAVAATASLGLLMLALQDLPAGSGYAVWTGMGCVLTAIGGILLLGESATPSRIAAITLTTAGIVWLSAAH